MSRAARRADLSAWYARIFSLPNNQELLARTWATKRLESRPSARPGRAPTGTHCPPHTQPCMKSQASFRHGCRHLPSTCPTHARPRSRDSCAVLLYIRQQQAAYTIHHSTTACACRPSLTSTCVAAYYVVLLVSAQMDRHGRAQRNVLKEGGAVASQVVWWKGNLTEGPAGSTVEYRHFSKYPKLRCTAQPCGDSPVRLALPHLLRDRAHPLPTSAPGLR